PAADAVLGAASPAKLQADLERVSSRLAAVRQQRDAALHLLQQLAAKFGCCPHCWGTNAGCATCAGRGSPGHFPPDPDLRQWLAPALALRPDVGASDPGAAPSGGDAADPTHPLA